MFSHNKVYRLELETTRMFRRVRQVAASIRRQRTLFVWSSSAPGGTGAKYVVPTAVGRRRQ